MSDVGVTDGSAADDGTVSWAELLDEAARRLEGLDARRIVEEITGAAPGELHTVLDAPATVRGVARLDSMVARREAGEPLQYVLGSWGFRTLDLMVDRRVLIPRPETEVVAGLAIDEVRDRGGTPLVVDLGTGSGAIALALAVECPRARVVATDVSSDALAVARANVAGVGRAGTRVTVYEGDWFSALPDELRGTVDVVVANPPYVADEEDLPAVVTDWEPVGALRAGPEGLDDLRRIVDEAPAWMAPGGVLVLEMAPSQTSVVARWCETRGLRSSVHDDLAGRPRAVVARRP